MTSRKSPQFVQAFGAAATWRVNPTEEEKRRCNSDAEWEKWSAGEAAPAGS